MKIKIKILTSTVGVAAGTPLFLFHRGVNIPIKYSLIARKLIRLSLRQPELMHSSLLEKVLIE